MRVQYCTYHTIQVRSGQNAGGRGASGSKIVLYGTSRLLRTQYLLSTVSGPPLRRKNEGHSTSTRSGHCAVVICLRALLYAKGTTVGGRLVTFAPENLDRGFLMRGAPFRPFHLKKKERKLPPRLTEEFLPWGWWGAVVRGPMASPKSVA
jgi:hypothetical protein